MSNERTRVCPVELAGSLDSKLRRWLQNPQKIVGPFIKEGMKVLDIGCGPGFFSVEMASMVGPKGKVYAVDMQEGMLKIIGSKIKGTVLESRMELIQCRKDKITVPEKVDFMLAFFMVHEVPDKERFFYDLKNALRSNGQFLIVEPKHIHVSVKDFKSMINIAEKTGFKALKGPGVFMSQTVILVNG